jgi:hypothetical protein
LSAALAPFVGEWKIVAAFELHLSVAPVVLGGGKQSLPDSVRLKLGPLNAASAPPLPHHFADEDG